MTAARETGWDAFSANRPDGLLEAKRKAEQAIGERIGWEPDWKLQQLMLKEQRQEEFSEVRSREMQQRIQRPDWSPKVSAWMKKAWAEGKFSKRVQGCKHRTPEKVARAKRLKADGWTHAQIAREMGISLYTVAQWLGWKRGAGTKRRAQPIVFEGVQYPSLSAAEKATGYSRHTIKLRTTA